MLLPLSKISVCYWGQWWKAERNCYVRLLCFLSSPHPYAPLDSPVIAIDQTLATRLEIMTSGNPKMILPAGEIG
jgi:hypothetical protein